MKPSGTSSEAGGWNTLNEAQAGDPALFWNTAKAVLKGKILADVTTHRRKVKHAYSEASSILKTAYTTFKAHPFPQNKDSWQTAKNEFELWVDWKEKIYRSHFESDLFCHRNKLGRMMANLARGHRRSSHPI